MDSAVGDSDDASTVYFEAGETSLSSVDGFDSLNPSVSFSSTIGDDASSVYSLDSTCRPGPYLEIEEIPDPNWCWSPTPQLKGQLIAVSWRSNISGPSPRHFNDADATTHRQQQQKKISSWFHSLAFRIVRRQQRPISVVQSAGNSFRSIEETTTQYLNGIRSEDVDVCIGSILPPLDTRVFTVSELKMATRFSKSNTDMFPGEGSSVKAFEGCVDEKIWNPKSNGEGRIVIVKQWNLNRPLGFKEWQGEIDLLGQLLHPKLVKLLGYYQEAEELILMYEYLSMRSFDNHFSRRGANKQSISWDFRLKTATSVARCITFLDSLNTPIIHRVMKPSTVHFDHQKYDAKLTCYGLLGGIDSDSQRSTRVIGTYGYAAPEDISIGYLFVKSDVYGFGAILLEMLSSLKVMDEARPKGQHYMWSKPFLSITKIANCMDRRLEGQYPLKAAYRTTQLALRCLSSDHRMRPSMKEVLHTLEQIETLKD